MRGWRRVAVDLAPRAQRRLLALRGLGAGIAGTAMPCRRQVFHQNWPGEIVTLRKSDARGGLQESGLFQSLDAFGDDRHAERLAERLDRLQDALAARALVDIGDERSVDLELVGGDVGQRRQ